MDKQVVVVLAHTSAYPDPVRVKYGESLLLGERDPAFPGWVRVTDPRGRTGWAPEALLAETGAGRAEAVEDYDATELEVAEGDRLSVIRELAGWLRVRDQDGNTGWVPAASTRPAPPGTSTRPPS